MKKTYTSAFKAKLVLELFKGDKSLAQLASEHKVHPNQLRNWRDLALQDFASLFDKKQQTADLQITHDRQVDEPYAQIGRSRGPERSAAPIAPLESGILI